ncbi:Pre-mRNA-splicing factor SYF2 [Cryptotrichosporon argae]
MPRARAVKSAAPSPSPRLEDAASAVSAPVAENAAVADNMADEGDAGGRGVANEGEDNEGDGAAEDAVGGVEDAAEAGEGRVSMEDRQAKLRELRARMNDSASRNRADLVEDHRRARVTAKDVARLEKQRKLAQTLRLKADADASGEDLERRKAWEWSIEQNERWERKEKEKEARQDQHFHNAEDDAHKRYERNLRKTPADLAAYAKQREAALGAGAGAASGARAVVAGPSSGLSRLDDFYRGADTLAYGDSKPSEEAVDRVISKINKDIGKKKRAKREDADEDVTYINDRNKVFNKKVARYFDKYTKDIKANLERGTAL